MNKRFDVQFVSACLVCLTGAFPHLAPAQGPKPSCSVGREGSGLHEPKSADAQSCATLGRLLVREGRTSEALSVFRNARSIDPQSFDAWYNAGLMLELLRRPQEALAEFTGASKINPLDAATYWHLGVAHLNLGTPSKAMEFFETAISLNAQDPLAWGGMAVAAYNLGDYSEARAHWARALEIDPDYFKYGSPSELSLYRRNLRLSTAHTLDTHLR